MSTRKSPLAYVHRCLFCQALFSLVVALLVGSDEERGVIGGGGGSFLVVAPPKAPKLLFFKLLGRTCKFDIFRNPSVASGIGLGDHLVTIWVL